MLRKWISTSYSRKIMALLLVCSAAAISLSGIVYYLSAIHILQNQYIASNNQLLAEVNQSVQRYYNQLNNVTLSLYSNSEFIENLRWHRDDYISQAANEQVIKSILYADDAILYIYFYDPHTCNLYSYSRENMSYTRYPALEEEDWYQDTLNAPKYYTVSPLHSFVNYTNFGTLRDATVFSVNRSLRYYADRSHIGMLSIVYSTDALEQICQNLDGENAHIAILDQDLRIRLTSYPDQELPGEVTGILKKHAGQSSHAVYHTPQGRRILLWHEKDGLYLLKDIPLSELTRETAQSVIRIMLLMSAAFILLAVAVSFYFSRTATRRLNALTMDVAAFGKGNLSVSSKDYGRDEIGTLASAFQEMVTRINELINLEYKAKLLQKNAELQMLQAQIKPHFINNTLQAMGTLGLKKGADEVYLMANALARTLRYTLKPTTELVPLSRELDNMNDYLYIQKILWGDKLHTDVQTETGLADWPVPVFILQPLVENAVKHGLDSSMEGTIVIRIRQAESSLVITVTDNGRGIPPTTLAMLQEWLRPDHAASPAEEHIGLRNIVGRIHLLYGEQASLTIDSILDHGTTIRLILPRQNSPHSYDTEQSYDRMSEIQRKEKTNVQSIDH